MIHTDLHSGSSEAPPSVRVALTIVGMAFVFGALIFSSAGRLDWPRGWGYLGLLVFGVAINWGCLLCWNPELIERRLRIGEGTKSWDKIWAALFAPSVAAIYVTSGFEAREGFSRLPWFAWPLGLVIFALGTAILTWSMVVNPFFEKTVRIQTDCGHRVIDSGPYAWVRHPGYVGLTGWIVSVPLLLDSLWAFIPVLLAWCGILIRTSLEDRTLRAELPGYSGYAGRVRYRVLPGVW